jgi:cytochrome bd-type quinol oxidase subunit 1
MANASDRELGRTSRRALVVLVYGAYALVAVFVASGAMDKVVMPSIQAIIAGLLAWTGVWVLSRMSRHWRWGQAPDETLDEREIAVRLRAYHFAYMIMTSTVFLALVVLSFWVDLRELSSFSYAQVSAVLWGVFLLGWTLPSAILAWIDRGVADD